MIGKDTPARELDAGMGVAVAKRSILRKKSKEEKVEPCLVNARISTLGLASLEEAVVAWAESLEYLIYSYKVTGEVDGMTTIEAVVLNQGEWENWADVAHRVALGNTSLYKADQAEQYENLNHHMRQASILMSGRHLQHGDASQTDRNMEVFTNCLDGGERILTMEYGPIEIEKVSGQEVTVIAGDGVPRKALINEHGEQELFEIEMKASMTGGSKNRKTVTATRNHRWPLADGSITDEVKIGDKIRASASTEERDPEAVIHGLIYGDGSAHKGRHDHRRIGASQGRSYVAIRICKQDVVAKEIHDILDEAGYSYSQPPHAKGDRVYYLGKKPYFKELPFTNDQAYVNGFIYGWWLADGSKTPNTSSLEISTINEEAANWLSENASFAGYGLTMHRIMQREEGSGCYANGKPLHVVRVRKGLEWKVTDIRPVGKAKVYCPEEPVTGLFMLANGILTGNCSTSATSFSLFYLALNGSGIGRAYDDEMMIVDWANAPLIVTCINSYHPDVASGKATGINIRDARNLYADRAVTEFRVPDSREGWGKAIELIETMTYEGDKQRHVLLLDFSDVRPAGSPINGMQDRPASGPGPMMEAVLRINLVRESGLAPWHATMFVDHYLSECVLVGGARRVARMSTKTWRDKSVFDFINIKRPTEFRGLTGEQIQEYVEKHGQPMGFLWTSNNSVTVDKEFWDAINKHEDGVAIDDLTEMEQHAVRVHEAACQASYYDGTGEPAYINQDMLTGHDDQFDDDFFKDGKFAESKRYKLCDRTLALTKSLVEAFKGCRFKMIVNPCGEIVLSKLGGYCVIADVVPYHAASLDDAEDAFRAATRALIRVNTMDSFYRPEVDRTNRIGVGFTGIHEFAWKQFGFDFYDLINELKSRDFWLTMSRFKRAVVEEAAAYSKKLGVVVPLTNTTVKPAGTTSKLFGLTEGCHLASMKQYLRWVQFHKDDERLLFFAGAWYPVKELFTYKDHWIVGFPTKPEICRLGMGDRLVTAAEATPEEQYQWMRLIEKYWIRGVEEDGVTPLAETGNQVSYTLKYKPTETSYAEFKRMLTSGQQTVRACSVMPQADAVAYEYQPEEPVSDERFQKIVDEIASGAAGPIEEDVGVEHVDCSTGACPINFNSGKL